MWRVLWCLSSHYGGFNVGKYSSSRRLPVNLEFLVTMGDWIRFVYGKEILSDLARVGWCHKFLFVHRRRTEFDCKNIMFVDFTIKFIHKHFDKNKDSLIFQPWLISWISPESLHSKKLGIPSKTLSEITSQLIPINFALTLSFKLEERLFHSSWKFPFSITSAI